MKKELKNNHLGSFLWMALGLVAVAAVVLFLIVPNKSAEAKAKAQTQYVSSKPECPQGAIDGVFSVSPTERVFFSQGNLRYQISSDTWSFAEKQYDIIGEDNTDSISPYFKGCIDLFAWGTSGWDCGNTYYHPWDTDEGDAGALYGPRGENNLRGDYADADWGVHNPISNGGDQRKMWRTLSKLEWEYLFSDRATSSGLHYAKAKVNGVNGLILLPDDWSANTYTLNETDAAESHYGSNMISASQWDVLEKAGAVFLPAAGIRTESPVFGAGVDGWYWTSSYDDEYNAYYVMFNDIRFTTNDGFYRNSGLAVRLVCPAE